MEQQVPFRNSMLWLSLLFLFSNCKPHTEQKKINSSDAGLSSVNGIVLYNDHPLSGTVFTLYPNSTDTAVITKFRNGKEDGEWKKFYEKGLLKEKRNFNNGRKTGEFVAYWDNGKKQLEYFFKNDEYEGTCREWNRDGMLIKEMNYKKGYEEGSQRMFYDNGKTRSNYIMLDGRRYGLLGTKNCINVSDSVFKK